ncbi:unnamed protein product, partial [marine sediment metagenome]
MLRPMAISALVVDSLSNSPIVILKEIDGERTLPIWIGQLEATAIASILQGIKFPRPMTHDLFKNIIDLINAKIKKVEICDLKDSILYALIYINHNGKEISLDARPTDALALALRVNAPIFVVEEVIQKAKQVVLKRNREHKSTEKKN